MYLQRVLIDQLGAENLFLGRHFVSYSKNENQVKIEFENGEVVYGDLLIGADGIHSNVRKKLRSVIGLEEINYRYCNQTCWRGVADINPDNHTYKSFGEWYKGSDRSWHLLIAVEFHACVTTGPEKITVEKRINKFRFRSSLIV